MSTTGEEALDGMDDATLADTCRGLGLGLITVDLDFAQILDYPPEDYAGLIVLRHPRPTLGGMRSLVRQVVEPGRIRIHGRYPAEEP